MCLHKNVKDKSGISSWKLVYDRFEPSQEGLREVLCALGNGYFASRGAFAESRASRIHYPGTYMAGVYNKVATEIAGREVFNEDFVNCPNWLFLTFKIGDGEWFTPVSMRKILCYSQELDMREGLLSKKICFRDKRGQRTAIETRRIVHMADPHRAAIQYTIIPENYQGWIFVRSSLDGSVENAGVMRYRQLNSKHLKFCSFGTFGGNGIYLGVETTQSKIKIAQAARVRIFHGRKEIKPIAQILKDPNGEICQEFRIFVRPKERYVIEKVVSIYTSKDARVKDALKASIRSLKSQSRFDVLLESHARAWDFLWKRFDIQVTGDEFSQRVLRLHAFHLLQTASFHNCFLDAGFPARGLHGEAYRGHIFWDAIFVLPFFDLRAPEISKALLLYRYRRLPQAQAYALQEGYQGAMYPWQSGSTGVEETQVVHLNPLSGKWGPDFSCIQRHVSFAIAYSVWQHWVKTGDRDFFIHNGAEMLLAIARFGASLLKYSAEDGRYHTEGLMGPDEFHEKLPDAKAPGFKDNAYTNLLIAWLLFKTKDIIEILPVFHKKRILKKLKLNQDAADDWSGMAEKINIIFNDEGIIAQFDGYFSLKELDWAAYKAKHARIDRMDRILKAEGKSPNAYKVTKQADVLMIFYLFPLSTVTELFQRLGYGFDMELLKKNYDYYVVRTSHGSTLSKVVHCYVAHILGRSKESRRWYQEVLKSDLYDTQGGTTSEGIHTGVMGGSVDITVRAFAGLEILEDRLRINPNLPKAWSDLKCNFSYQDKSFYLTITKKQLTILFHALKFGRSTVPVEINHKMYQLRSEKMYKVSLKRGKGSIKNILTG